MKHFTQEQAAEMYRALKSVSINLRNNGFVKEADPQFHYYAMNHINAALAHADSQPVTAPSADMARAVIAHLEQRPQRIIELNPLDVMEMERQVGIDAADEPIPDPLTIEPLPSFQRYAADHNLLSAHIAEEGVAE